jgi:hypothetical protein
MTSLYNSKDQELQDCMFNGQKTPSASRQLTERVTPAFKLFRSGAVICRALWQFSARILNVLVWQVLWTIRYSVNPQYHVKL